MTLPLSRLLSPPSIGTYILWFVACSLLLMAFMAHLMFTHLDQVERQAGEVRNANALIEIERALEAVHEEVHGVFLRLARWDESRQQLDNPLYYAYWHELRLRRSDLLPGYIEAVHYYDKDRQALGQLKDIGLPDHLETDLSHTYVEMNESGAYLLHQEAVIDPDLGEVIGFILLRSELLRTLREIYRFHHLLEDSLSFTATPGKRILLKDAAERLHYQLQESEGLKELRKSVEQYLIRLGLTVAGMSAFLYLLLIVLVGRPLRGVSQHIERLRSGSSGLVLQRGSFSVPVFELEMVRKSLNDYQQKLSEVHESLDEKNQELWTLAHIDPLTRVANRRAFEDDWRSLQQALEGQRLPFAFMLFDCNHFKAINDSYGHEVGDKVLKGLASCLQGAMRHGDKLYRIGGDEFAALLVNCDSTSARYVAERCLEAAKTHDFSNLGMPDPVRISMGIANAEYREGSALSDLRWQADAAMYHAKRPASGYIAEYSDSMARDSQSMFSSWVNTAVYRAIETGEGLELAYQPIVDLSTGESRYFEALVRIYHENELILPGQIFPVVEARNLEEELDHAVLMAALRDLKAHRIPLDKGLSINLSANSVVSPNLLRLLDEFVPHLEQHMIVLEVTETTLITQMDAATENLQAAREMGFLIALDDFGSGYSSLRYLSNMPVDIVKFDISMVRSLDNPDNHALVSGLANIIHQAGYKLVAEGIETDETLSQVIEVGFGYGQGYLFSKPLLHPSANTGLRDLSQMTAS